jgi:hypothetical protein
VPGGSSGYLSRSASDAKANNKHTEKSEGRHTASMRSGDLSPSLPRHRQCRKIDRGYEAFQLTRDRARDLEVRLADPQRW